MKPDRIHVSWGPEGEKLDPEEKQKIMDQLLADAAVRRQEHDKAEAALAGLPYAAVPIDQLADVYARMLRLTKLAQATIEEWSAQPKEVSALKHKIFEQSDFGAVYAGQWLPRDVRDATREQVEAERFTVNPSTTK